MRIIKSMRTGLLSRTFLYRRQHFFTATVLWGFRLDTGHNVLEPHVWEAIGKLLEAGQPFDQAMPKGRPEFLVSGSFYAPGGKPVSGGSVGVTVGGVSKVLSVSGDRYWRPWGMSRPEPFSEMPIDYRHAFGGEKFARNPLGKGDAPVPGEEGEIHPLPNVEYASSAVSSPGSKPAPAAYDHLGVMWEQRLRHSGTYNDQYLRDAFLGLPDDIDWRYFNDAAEDQWFDADLRGDEPFDIRNMHPEHPHVTGQLPGIRGRCFVEQAVVGEDTTTRIREIPLKADTVWLFPGQMMGVVMARGTIEVAEDDGSDILNLLLAAENQADSPRPAQHYISELRKRADLEQGFRYLLQTGPLLPLDCTTEFEELGASNSDAEESAVSANMEQFSKAQQAKLSDDIEANSNEVVAELEKRGLAEPATGKLDLSKLASGAETESADEVQIKALLARILPGVGDDPGKLDPSKMLADLDFAKFAELDDYLKSITNRELVAAKEKLEASKEQVGQQLDPAQAAETRNAIDQQVHHLDELIAGNAVVSAVQPLPRPERELHAQIDAQFKQLNEQKSNLEASLQSDKEANVHAMAQLGQIEQAWEDAQHRMTSAIDQLRDQHRITAQYLDPASSPHPGQEPQIAENLLSAHRKGEPTAGGDYAFVDLSGQNLRGIDLSGARLEYANLSGCDLTESDLTGAVLTHAVLDHACFRHVCLDEANLGRCQMEGTVFEHCKMTGVILSFAKLRGSEFDDCDLRGGLMPIQEVQFKDCAFNRVRLDEHTFLDCGFSNCTLSDSTLNKVVMINPELAGSVFTRCELNGASLLMAKAEGVAFKECQMRNSRLMGGCRLTGADFSGSLLDESTLRDASLAHAIFTGASINQSDFSGVEASDACFDRIVGRKSLWYKAELQSATFRRADLMEASLHKARLQEADFSYGSLYEANLLQVTLSNTRFHGCIMSRTLLQDWRPPAT